MSDPKPTFDPPRPLVIGLLGGIAAGKSTVAAMFAAHGLRHVDADLAARAVVARPEVLAALRREFGDRVFGADGGLDRAALGQIVFADEAARGRLEAITHPAIRSHIEDQLATAARAGASVLLDAPLLLEGGLIDRCDVAVFVEADATTRRRRAAERGWVEGELERREATQAGLELKRRRAGFIIRTGCTTPETEQQVREVLARLSGHPAS